MRFLIVCAVIALAGCESSSVHMSMSIDSACNVQAIQEFRRNGQLLELTADQRQAQEEFIRLAQQQAGC